MRDYCNICRRDIKKKSKHSHEDFEKHKHIILSLKNVDMKDYNKKFTQYLLKAQFKLVFINQDCKYLITDMIHNTSNISWSN